MYKHTYNKIEYTDGGEKERNKKTNECVDKTHPTPLKKHIPNEIYDDCDLEETQTRPLPQQALDREASLLPIVIRHFTSIRCQYVRECFGLWSGGA
jgi:hypothetical protein